MPVHHKETPLVERIISKLQADISAGLIPMGTRLNEADLAEEFGTSRTPVRRALAALATLDVVVARGTRGHFIPTPTQQELAQLFEAMHEVEIFALRVAKKRLDMLSKNQIEAAHELCKVAAQEGDIAGFLRANERFHMSIYEATRNVYLADIATSFRLRTGAIRARRYQTHEDVLNGVDGHEFMISFLFNENTNDLIETLSDRISKQYSQNLSL